MAILEAFDAGTNHLFGSGVSIQGDLALVGADGANTCQGAAYLFDRNAGGLDSWGLHKKILPADIDSGSVARSSRTRRDRSTSSGRAGIGGSLRSASTNDE